LWAETDIEPDTERGATADDAFVATETEAKEIVTKAKEFVEFVEQWIAKNHSSFKP
jgi:hypothetical protein